MSRPITFLVNGHDQTRSGLRGALESADQLPSGAVPRGTLKQSVRVAGQRAAGGEVAVSAVPGRDVVVLHIAGGPALTLHPETARDLLAAQATAAAGRGAGPAADPDAAVPIPVELRWRGLDDAVAVRGSARGFFGRVTITAVDVLSDLFTGEAADFTARRIAERVDSQVAEGVYRLAIDALPPLKENAAPLAEVPPRQDGPLLVLCHGTFSNTSGTFSQLWTHHPQRVRAIFKRYGDQVYGLDHRTLGATPIDNALTLVRALPPDTRLHLLTHSRGGLVAETLARIAADPDDLAPFAQAGSDQVRQLKALAATVKEKRPRVERVVRVACPARGTLLASKRLDAYLSIFNWTLQLAGIPVLPALVDFLAAVASRREDEALLPGLAAQIPDGPLVQWLHAARTPLPGDLRVIAGDVKGDSVASWLKTLASDAFFWTDHDFVVQTRSMYGGAPRAAGAEFLLDQRGKVSHFGYFANATTAEAITAALTDDRPHDFQAIGPLSLAGESSTGMRAWRPDQAPSADRPALFVLPGILGSHLRVGNDRVWLGWRIVNGLSRLAYTGEPDGVEPDGAVGRLYDHLIDFFSATHQVVEFSFDWRKPIEEEARRLAKAVDEALDFRETTGQPVRIIAHSMGGLLARALQLEAPAVWARMIARPGGRLLMLGTPNGGSWAPMQVLSGDETFGNTLAAVGAPFRQASARGLMAALPGFLQLQAGLLEADTNLQSEARWKELRAADLARVRDRSLWHRLPIQLDCVEWGVPPQAVLDRAAALRRRLDAQVEQDLPAFSDKLLLVTGKAASTPDGYELGDSGVVYLDVQHEGDGRVTLESARLPGVRTWTLDADHASLASMREAFPAYLELLEQGTTTQLSALEETTARGSAARPTHHVRSRPSRARIDSTPAEGEQALFMLEGQATADSPADPGTALRVTVTNGDLAFVHQPIFLGHYTSTRLTGTEAVMNRHSGGVMEVSLRAGLYPDRLGAHQVFINTGESSNNPLQPPRPEAVIVVGLGPEGELRPAGLADAMQRAVVAWAQRVAEKDGPKAPLFEISATLIGSGGSGMTAAQSAQLLAQAVRDANRHIAEEPDEQRRWPQVGHLHLIELYHDRAVEALRALQLQASAMPGQYALTDTVQIGIGPLRRPLDAGYRGADYDFIRAASEGVDGASGVISYTLDTRRARTEVRAQSTQMTLLRTLIESASNDRHLDPQIGRTLFQLLVPSEMEPFLSGSTEIQIELDRGTAGIPWELLDTNTGERFEAKPWAIRTKLLRKLRTTTFRTQVADAQLDARVLVIGEPECDVSRYPRLPGAREEALAVVEQLTGPRGLATDRVTALISPTEHRVGANARTIINALFEHDWRIVHIAGHGEPPELATESDAAGTPRVVNPRGVVLSDKIFLGPHEIASMRKVPELVFVNCCHLARAMRPLLEGDRAVSRRNWPQFAFTVAEALIDAGVRCVIAAGWAVDDLAASVFAARFYDSLLRGSRFIDAVRDARSVAHAMGGHTWAAYQCYGDPDWHFRRESADPQRPGRALADEFGAVASTPGLLLALQTLTVRSEFQKPPNVEEHAAHLAAQRERIKYLEARFAPSWGTIGAVAEAFAAAWAAADDRDAAVRWYRKAIAANDGTASRKAVEQLGNLEVRAGWEDVHLARRRLDERPRAAVIASRRGRRNGKPAASTSRGPDAALAKAMAAARVRIGHGMALLTRLNTVQSTMEGESLIGSAYKRLAMIERLAGRGADERRALVKMQRHYARAEACGREQGLTGLYYPIMNRLAADLLLNAPRPGWKGLDQAALEDARVELAAINRDNPDFWSIISQTELAMYDAISGGELHDRLPAIARALRDLHARIGSASKWRSVYDQVELMLGGIPRGVGAEAKAMRELRGLLAAMAGVESATSASRRSRSRAVRR